MLPDWCEWLSEFKRVRIKHPYLRSWYDAYVVAMPTDPDHSKPYLYVKGSRTRGGLGPAANPDSCGLDVIDTPEGVAVLRKFVAEEHRNETIERERCIPYDPTWMFE